MKVLIMFLVLFSSSLSASTLCQYAYNECSEERLLKGLSGVVEVEIGKSPQLLTVEGLAINFRSANGLLGTAQKFKCFALLKLDTFKQPLEHFSLTSFLSLSKDRLQMLTWP